MNFKRMKWLKIIGLSFAAFILAFFLPLPLFILSIAGIFYFSKKKPDKTLRNLSIALAVLSFIGVGMNDTNTPESTEKETEVAVVQESEEEKSAESESLEKAKQKELEEKESKELEEKESKEAEEKALEEKESKEKEEALIAQKESEEEETRQMLLEAVENDMILSFIDTFNTDVPGMVMKQDESDPKNLYVHVVDKKLSTEISLALVSETYRESFNALLDSLVTLSRTVEETIGDEYAFILLNPINEENTIAIVMSGVVVYNAFDELD